VGKRRQPCARPVYGHLEGNDVEIEVQDRFPDTVGHGTRMETPSHKRAPGQEQGATGIPDVPLGSNGIVRRSSLLKPIILQRDDPILGESAGRDPPTVGDAEVVSDIERCSIDSGLTARPNLEVRVLRSTRQKASGRSDTKACPREVWVRVSVDILQPR